MIRLYVNIFLIIFVSLSYLWLEAKPNFAYVSQVDVKSPAIKLIINKELAHINSISPFVYRKGYYPITIKVDKLGDTILGTAEPSAKGCEIVLNIDMFTEDYKYTYSTIVHELGHCYGFYSHSESQESVMYPSDTELGREAVDKFVVDKLAVRATSLFYFTKY